MSVDDQLFKEDGTLITKIDIFLLKVARKIATFFADEDDETFTPALKKFYKIGILFLVLSGIFYLISFKIAEAFLQFYIAFLFNKLPLKCRGSGTNGFEIFQKFIGILLVSLDLSIVAKSLIPLDEGRILLGVGLLIVHLSIIYIVRLGGEPPKKKKAEVLKPALSMS